MGFFGGQTGRNIAGSVGDFLLQQAGARPIYAPAMERRQEAAEKARQPYRFQNNNGDVVEVDPATGQQRVLYQDTPKPDIPAVVKEANYYRSIGRNDLADAIEAKNAAITAQVVSPATGAIELKAVNPSDLFPGFGAAAPAAPSKPLTDEDILKRRQGGAAPANGPATFRRSGGFFGR